MSKASKEYFSASERETEALAAVLAEKVQPGAIFCLRGELGAGKTVFARGFARGLGISGRITSPTFCIVNEYYDGRMPFYHFDAYRLTAPEILDVGFDDMLFGEGVCLIEWADNILSLIPENATWVEIKRTSPGSDKREILVKRTDRLC